MDRPAGDRRHLSHRDAAWGTVFVTWRVHRSFGSLTPAERDSTLDVITRTPSAWCELLAVVVMDDHAHVLATLRGMKSIAQLAHVWKSISAHEIVRSGSRHAPIWQPEYFDRWMESGAQIEACVQYVLRNPIRRWPRLRNYWWVVDLRGSGPRGAPPRLE